MKEVNERFKRANFDYTAPDSAEPERAKESTLKERFTHDAVTLDGAPQVLVVAVKLPHGAIETITNCHGTAEKVAYYMHAYDDDFRLNNNKDIQIVGYMIV